jgi:hypothetical protein
LHEDRLIKKARMFVDTVEMYYPEVRRVFEKIRIPDDDVIAQALCCEIALETYHIEKVSDVLRKAGIGIPSVPKKVRRKREEVEKTEDKQTENKPKRKVFQYDGKLLFAANQLAVKLFHLNPRREPEKVILRTKKLLEDIWRCSRELQLTKESGRVGEALGVSGPSRKGRFTVLRPAVRLGPLRKQGTSIRDGAFQGPRHPAVLITLPPSTNPPLFHPLILTGFIASMGSRFNRAFVEVHERGRLQQLGISLAITSLEMRKAMVRLSAISVTALTSAIGVAMGLATYLCSRSAEVERRRCRSGATRCNWPTSRR